MGDITIFKRYELKYRLTREQKERLLTVMADYMKIDEYGRSVIRNIYYDTDDYLLIRRSIEKPVYKEKLRIRSYKKATQDSKVFVELKKKYKHVVYKRRLTMHEADALKWIAGEESGPVDTQIGREIDYFRTFYKNLKPAVFLSYEREAYYMMDGSDFRVTFDDNIFARQTDVSLESEAYGTPLIGDNEVMMELKVSGAIPLWMTAFLSKEKIYKTSFSKYGTFYKKVIEPEMENKRKNGDYARRFIYKKRDNIVQNTTSDIKHGSKVSGQ